MHVVVRVRQHGVIVEFFGFLVVTTQLMPLLDKIFSCAVVYAFDPIHISVDDAEGNCEVGIAEPCGTRQAHPCSQTSAEHDGQRVFKCGWPPENLRQQLSARLPFPLCVQPEAILGESLTPQEGHRVGTDAMEYERRCFGHEEPVDHVSEELGRRYLSATRNAIKRVVLA